jgi:c-di-GMP-binding flagellar brake protein YcgR
MPPNDTQLERGDKVTDISRTTGILKRIVEHRTLLTVTFPKKSGTYNSAILEVHPDQQYLLLDELNPKEGHTQFLASKTVNIRASVKGVETRFSAQLQDVIHENGIYAYKVAFPREVWHLQRRQRFRVSIGVGKRIAVQMKTKEGTILNATMQNISASGMGMVISSDIRLARGTIIPECTFTLAGGDRITCQLEIRYSSTQMQPDGIYAGGRFYNLSRAEQRLISKQITRIQRDLIQTLPRDQLE